MMKTACYLVQSWLYPSGHEIASLPIEPEEPKSSLPLTAFHVFPNLPTELRLQIWNTWLVNSEPQIIELAAWDSDRKKYPARMFAENYIDFIPHRIFTAIPPLFHVNSESRREAARIYERLDNVQRFKYMPPQAFLRLEKDTILVNDDHVLYHLLYWRPKSLKEVRSIAISQYLQDFHNPDKDLVSETLPTRFPSLTELCLVAMSTRESVRSEAVGAPQTFTRSYVKVEEWRNMWQGQSRFCEIVMGGLYPEFTERVRHVSLSLNNSMVGLESMGKIETRMACLGMAEENGMLVFSELYRS